MRQGLVSVVYVSKDRRADLTTSVQSVLEQAYADLEVLVIDNGSTDGTAEAIARQFPTTRVFRAATNLGTCVTRNAGLQLSRGEYVWFLDSDTVVTDADLVAKYIRILTADANIAAIGGEALVDEEERVVGVKSLNLTANGMHARQDVLGPCDGRHYPTGTLATCNFFARREVLEQVGGFDPWYFFYLEDQDLSYRIRKRGYELRVLGGVPVIHRFSESFRKVNVWQIGRNRKYFVLRHYALGRVLLMPFFDLAYVVSLGDPVKVKRAALLSSHGTKGFALAPSSAQHQTTAGGLARMGYRAASVLVSMLAGYLLVVPHIPRAIAHRLKERDFLPETDLGLFKTIHEPTSTDSRPSAVAPPRVFR